MTLTAIDRLQTAKAIVAKQSVQIELMERSDLRERYMGQLQGRQFVSDAHLKKWMKSDETVEKTEVFGARAIRWWEEDVLARISGLPARKDAYNVLAVTHGGFLTTLVHKLVQTRKIRWEMGMSIAVPTCYNASVTVIEVEEDGQGHLERYSDISHLAGAVVVQGNADIVRT